MYKRKLEEIKKLVIQEYEKFNRIDAWKYHVKLVLENALNLAKKYKCNKEIVFLSAIFHDIGIIKYGSQNHEVTSAEEAEKMLKKFNYDLKTIEHVKRCIIEHRDKISSKATSIESEILRNADVLALFDAIPYFMYLTFLKFQNNFEGACNWIISKLSEDLNAQLFPEVKKKIEKRYKILLLLFKKLKK